MVHAAAQRQAANVCWPRVQVGTSAAPLRKELMDSGLGEALVGGGLQGDLRQPVFSIGLKGAAPENFQQVHRGAAGCLPC
jgi:Zn-dependent M16 (insulinase) family peptidase